LSLSLHRGSRVAIIQPLVTELHGFGRDRHTRAGAPDGRGHWPPHLHSFHQFDVTLAGAAELVLPGRRSIAERPGAGVLIPPLIPHAYSTTDHFDVAMFKFAVAPAARTALGGRPFRIELAPATLEAVAVAWQAVQRRRPWAEQHAVAALTLCLAEARSSLEQSAVPDEPTAPTPLEGGSEAGAAFLDRLGAALEAVERDPFAAWTVAGLADRCHLTADHFSRCFRQALNEGPQEYLLAARIRAAARALASTPRPSIKAVAAQAGYASVHSFSRAFRKVTGQSPGRFRSQPSEL
ncbi:MAG: AraC family transcriptional regulator, partial [Terriglobales bacterium]